MKQSALDMPLSPLLDTKISDWNGQQRAPAPVTRIHIGGWSRGDWCSRFTRTYNTEIWWGTTDGVNFKPCRVILTVSSWLLWVQDCFSMAQWWGTAVEALIRWVDLFDPCKLTGTLLRLVVWSSLDLRDHVIPIFSEANAVFRHAISNLIRFDFGKLLAPNLLLRCPRNCCQYSHLMPQLPSDWQQFTEPQNSWRHSDSHRVSLTFDGQPLMGTLNAETTGATKRISHQAFGDRGSLNLDSWSPSPVSENLGWAQFHEGPLLKSRIDPLQPMQSLIHFWYFLLMPSSKPKY